MQPLKYFEFFDVAQCCTDLLVYTPCTIKIYLICLCEEIFECGDALEYLKYQWRLLSAAQHPYEIIHHGGTYQEYGGVLYHCGY